MDSLRRVVRNSSALMASNVLGKGISFLYVLLAARYLGTIGYGLLAFSLSLGYLFRLLVDLGFTPLIVKDVARDNTRAVFYIRKIMQIKAYLFVISLVLLLLTMKSLGYSGGDALVVYMVFIFVVLQSFADTGYAVLRALEEIHYVAYGEVLMSATILIGFAGIAYGGYGVSAFSAIYVVSGCIIVMYSFFMVKRILVEKSLWDISRAEGLSGFALMKESLPFALMAAFNLILLYLDSVMLGIFRTQSEVGIYGVAYRSAIALSFIPLAVHISMVPVISRLFGEGSDSVERNVGRLFRYNLILSVPLGVGGTLFSWKIIPIVFGSQYSEASLIFAVLIWSLVLSFMRFPFNTLFEATDRQFTLSRLFAYAAALNIILNAALIPPYGMVGAAIATVCTDLLLVLAVIYLGVKAGVCNPVNDLLIFVFKVVLSATVMGFACLLSSSNGTVFSIITGIVIYSVLIWATRSLDEDDKVLLRKAAGL